MSDESILPKEDKEDLLYIARKIHMEDFAYTEEHSYVRESLNSEALAADSDVLSAGEISALEHVVTKELGPHIFKDPLIITKTTPFHLNWSFGINPKVRIKNLTTRKRTELFFASSHFPIVYNYCSKTMNYLEGHHHLITSISADKSGRWLATAGNGDDGLLNIWDSSKTSESGKTAPVLSMYSVYGKYGIDTVQISPSARYLITIGGIKEDAYAVNMWLWTLGNDTPEDSYRVSNVHGYPVTICYNPNIEEHIMLVFSKQVILLVWDKEAKKFTTKVIPQIMHRSRIGHLTDATYVDKCHECFASSSRGCVLTFGNTLYAKPFEEGELDNSKIFRNVVKISQDSIECCVSIDGLIVTCDTGGKIYFFNNRLLILYWLRDFNLGPIASISFNLIPRMKFQEAGRYYVTPTKDDKIFNCDFTDMVEELEVLFQQNLPVDATRNRAPFIVRDFFVATNNCTIYAIDVINNKCTPVFNISDNNVVAIETHEESDYLLIAYASNRIVLLNYVTHEVINEGFLPRAKDEDSTISCIKYSPASLHLVCGKTNGEIWILEPILLRPQVSEPFALTKNKVMKIAFSSVPVQFAYYDENRTVAIFEFDSGVGKWKNKGKIRPHYKEITDIMFVPSIPSWKLFTISYDRHIVEYNNDKLSTEEFKIESSDRIEQTSVPLSFINWVSTIGVKSIPYILFADNHADSRYIELIQNIYKEATCTVNLHENTNPTKIQRGIKQGVSISLTSFTLVLEDVFKEMKWDSKGLMINGNDYSILRFSEIWLTEDQINYIHLENYSLATYYTRTHHIRGGVAIFVKNGLQYMVCEVKQNVNKDMDFEHKLKFLYQTTKIPKAVVLAPAFGCFKNQLIRKMEIIPQCDSKYMAFATNRHFGIHIIPPDGNPYKYVGYFAHPEKLEDFAISWDGQFIFTFGTNDHCVFKWQIETKAVEYMKYLGGKELEPFYCLIEGGYHGWLFHEIKDLFYYMQILQQETVDLPRRVTDSICITEIPDLFRTIGFYPSDFELENIMIDVKFRHMDETGKMNDDVSFIDFVKLYCNHKPIYGYYESEIIYAFNLLVQCDPKGTAESITRDKFIEFLTTEGEPIAAPCVFKYFRTLMRNDSAEENFEFLPNLITFKTFFENILGIDIQREKIVDYGEGSSEEDTEEDKKTQDVPTTES